MADVHRHTEAWEAKPWKKFEVVVFRLQKRIYRASTCGNRRTVHKLQRLLLTSSAARHLAVRRVTQENQGRRTAGIDGVSSTTPRQRLEMVEALKDLDGKPSPVRRIYIPKKNGEQRGLGIPTMQDRAKQALVKMALEPEWEARFEPNSYGFRPGRSTHDAIQAIFNSIKLLPKYVLDADIEKCFDQIDHDRLLRKLDTFPRLRRLIRSWMKAGMLEGDRLFPTRRGVPQGSPLSPLLTNVALHGLETALVESQPTSKDRLSWKPTVVRYADDWVVLHRDLQTLQELKERAEKWLAEVGLRLHPEKTQITHTLRPYRGRVGFDFLGFEVRQYEVGKYRSGKDRQGKPLGFKTLIKPSKSAQKRYLQKTGAIIKRSRGQHQNRLIGALRPTIKGWSRYYRHVVSKDVFDQVDMRLHHQLYRWAKRRHPQKHYRWLRRRYWRRVGGRVSFGKDTILPQCADPKIERHVKVAGRRSPYDGDWTYWGVRLRRYAGLSPLRSKLLSEQDGKCVACSLRFRQSDRIEMHHRDGNRSNNSPANLALLHLHCHDEVHGTPDKGCQT